MENGGASGPFLGSVDLYGRQRPTPVYRYHSQNDVILSNAKDPPAEPLVLRTGILHLRSAPVLNDERTNASAHIGGGMNSGRNHPSLDVMQSAEACPCVARDDAIFVILNAVKNQGG